MVSDIESISTVPRVCLLSIFLNLHESCEIERKSQEFKGKCQTGLGYLLWHEQQNDLEKVI